jgi:hypothetical protein
MSNHKYESCLKNLKVGDNVVATWKNVVRNGHSFSFTATVVKSGNVLFIANNDDPQSLFGNHTTFGAYLSQDILDQFKYFADCTACLRTPSVAAITINRVIKKCIN